jgi:N-acetylglucosamine-6-phosphate deacetylase
MKRLFLLAGWLMLFVFAQAQDTPYRLPNVYALRGAKIVSNTAPPIENGVIVVRNGVIAALGDSNTPIPADAEVIDASGHTVYPGFIDAFSSLGMPAQANDPAYASYERGNTHPNAQIRPERQATVLMQPDSGQLSRWRRAGFAVAHIAPPHGILSGQSAVISLNTGSAAELVVVPQVGVVMNLRGRGAFEGGGGYPSSLMGAIALVRQTFYDAQHQQQAWQAYLRDPNGKPRPAMNRALEALQPVLERKLPLLAIANNAEDIRRVLRIADEFNLKVVIVGGLEAAKVADELKRRNVPVLLSMEMPEPLRSYDPLSPPTLTSLRNRALAYQNAAILHEQGVRFAFTTEGLGDPERLLRNIRTAIANGLPKDAALRALTLTPAELLGIQDKFGDLAVGKTASFVVIRGELFEPRARIEFVFADGKRFKASEGTQAAAAPTPPFRRPRNWDAENTASLQEASCCYHHAHGSTLTHMQSHDHEAHECQSECQTLLQRNHEVMERRHEVMDAASEVMEHRHEVMDAASEVMDAASEVMEHRHEVMDAASEVMDAASEVMETLHEFSLGSGNPLEGNPRRLVGYLQASFGEASGMIASPQDSPRESGAPQAEPSQERRQDSPDDAPVLPRVKLTPIMPPPADEHNTWLIRNATVWTLAHDKPLPNTDVLVVDGKIAAVGKNLTAPPNARVIDGTGKHLTPGLMDCHSHTAISGGVNEGTNVCTAEVRIQDVINPEDVNIYRQLAGGLTGALMLHGSANVIGGQSITVKWRWGKPADELIFKEAPSGIKFALGENVKRSNFRATGPQRYPASRMGVEQVIRERFLAALDYKRHWEEYRAGKRPLPPQRDLQLDALVEILEGKRLIHCHSYRQDEILMLLRVCEEFGVRVGTLQHVLEGYKVANEIARHGAGASSFSDWWAYKIEVYDAIPHNGAIMWERGVVVTFNSDSNELARRMNTEATKAVKYGGVPEVEALKFVTLNVAKQLGVDRYVGSIEVGKHADLALWSDHPLSGYAVCEKTFVDGVLYFDRERDRAWREELEKERQEYLKGLRAESVFDERRPEREERREQPAESPRGESAPNFAGVWQGTITGGDPLPPEGVPFTLRIRQEGGRLVGTLETLLGSQEFSIAAPSGDTLTFTLEAGGMSITVNATVSGDRLTGTINAMGLSFTIEGRRAPNV